MIKSDRQGNIVQCFPDPNAPENIPRKRAANVELIRRVRELGGFGDRATRILDVGSGSNGSKLVNLFGEIYQDTDVVYLDSAPLYMLGLGKKITVYADATSLPFANEAFDIVYAGNIINNGIVVNHHLTGNESAWIASEAFRTLRRDGLFLFTYHQGDDRQTVSNLSKIGFRMLEHLQCILHGASPKHTYGAQK